MLNNCVQSSASLFGPAFTIAKTGNVYHAGFSYASNNIIHEKLGKSPTEYIGELLTTNSKSNGLVLALYKEEKNKKILVVSKNSVDKKNAYNDFLNAVKKTLK